MTNVHLIEPLDYLPFVLLMSGAELILTDSGGIQEEAPSLGLRVVVMRAMTERSEGIDTGLIRLAGADRDHIVTHAMEALTGKWMPRRKGRDVYGDGRASERVLAAFLSSSEGRRAGTVSNRMRLLAVSFFMPPDLFPQPIQIGRLLSHLPAK